MASGLLVIALGQATKMIPFLSPMSEVQCRKSSDFGLPTPDFGLKEYLFSIKWGIRTDTGDVTGNIIEDCRTAPIACGDCQSAFASEGEFIGCIEKILPRFIGEYDQTPPTFSAKKINGVPAYKMARQGLEVKLTPKRVKIYEFTIHNSQCTIADNLIYRVKCSAGTYIRSLVQDMAARAGSIAAASMIRRTKTNGFSVENAITLDFLEKIYNNGGAVADFLKPPDFGLDGIPVAELEHKDAVLFSNGGFIPSNGDGFRRAYSGGNFIGMGKAEGGLLKPERVIK
jgi:tRNA pseudouridine55 synthase